MQPSLLTGGTTEHILQLQLWTIITLSLIQEEEEEKEREGDSELSGSKVTNIGSKVVSKGTTSLKTKTARPGKNDVVAKKCSVCSWQSEN